MEQRSCPKCKKDDVLKGREIDLKNMEEWIYFICQKCEHVWYGEKRKISI